MKIKIIKKIPFFGDGDTLETRLKQVTLRGFPKVTIYKDASFAIKKMSPPEVERDLYTPQPHVYRDHLNRVAKTAELFANEGINIYYLENAYDYIARDDSGTETTWTMLPPVIETFRIPQHKNGGFDYVSLVGTELANVLQQNNWHLEPATRTTPYHNQTDVFNLINDGSHRVHAGVETGDGITILQITNITPGFPYYAVPQHYSHVKVFPKKDDSTDLKVHVVTSPGHKQLFRVFPSGGILSGDVRPPRISEVFV